MPRRLLHCTALLAALAPSCDAPPPCRLVITAPTDGALIGPKDDISSAIPGIQINVTVSAANVPDGATVRLSSGDVTSTGTVAGGQVVFSAFTLAPNPNGDVVLIASYGACTSDQVGISLPSSSVLIHFKAPPDGFVLGAADNQNPDPGDLTFVYDVKLITTAESGLGVTLTVNGLTQAPTLVQGGSATFKAVVLPPGAVTLVATVTDRYGNSSSTQSAGTINTHPPPCEAIGFYPGAMTVPGLLTPVLNAQVDAQPKTPGEQTRVIAKTDPNDTVHLLIDGMDRGARAADALGDASFEGVTIAEGAHVVQVRCVTLANSVDSPKLAVFVDSIAPLCRLSAPSQGQLFGLASDVDPGRPGVQVAAALASPSPDAEGRPVFFGVNGADQGAPSVAITGGTAAHEVTLSAPGNATNTITGTVSDSAGNPCVASVDVGLGVSGCAIIFLRPKAVAPPQHAIIRVDDDVSPPIDDGLQYDVAFAVSLACLGKRVHLTVDGKTIGPDALVVADPGQKLGARADFPAVTVCPKGPNGAPPSCHDVYPFFASVTDGGGDVSSASLSVLVSAVPPMITLGLAPPQNGLPALRCGDTVTPPYDVDPRTDGVQIQVITTTAAQFADVRASGPFGDAVYSPQSVGSRLATVTVPEGYGKLVARAVDGDGNSGYSMPCALSLQGLQVGFSKPVAGGVVRAAAATIAGTVSVANASIAVSVDDNPLGSTLAAGTAWSFAPMPIPAGPGRVLRVVAVAGGHAGTAAITVTSDGQAPAAIADLVATALRRSRVGLAFSAPADDNPPVASYLLRWAFAPITAQTFAQATPVAAPMPAAPGTRQAGVVSALYPGLPAWFAIQSLDRAGNPSPISNAPTVTPTFTRSLQAAPQDGAELSGKRGFGQAAAGGDLDGDGFADLVVGAPQASFAAADAVEGAIYVYFGGPNGTPGTPDAILHGGSRGGHAGSAIAVGDLNADGRADLAVGVPGLTALDKNGAAQPVGGVYVYYGGSLALARGMAPRMLDPPDVLVLGDPDQPSVAPIGATLAALRFDADLLIDLAIGTPGAMGGGCALVLLGSPMLPSSVHLPGDALSGAVPGFRLLCGGFPGGATFGDSVADAGALSATAAHALAVVSTPGARVALFAAPPAMGGQPGPVDVDGPTRALALVTDAPGSGLGVAVAGAPDGDGNGFGELLLGEPSYGQGAGRVLRIDGAKLPGLGASLDASAAATTIFAGQMGDGLGASVAAADLTGDGNPDLIFGLAGRGGQVRTIYAGPSGGGPYLPGAPTVRFPIAAGAVAAQRALLCGDLDGDGLADLTTLDPGFGNGAGRIEIYR